MHVVAGLQRELAHRHPWLVAAVSHLQPLGPATLALLEFALGALEPAGLSARDRLETIAMINGFVLYSVRAELARDAARSGAAGQAVRDAAGTARHGQVPAVRRGDRAVAASRRRSTRPPTSTG